MRFVVLIFGFVGFVLTGAAGCMFIFLEVVRDWLKRDYELTIPDELGTSITGISLTDAGSSVVVTRTPATVALRLLGVAIGAWLVLFTVTSRIPGARLPMLDAALVALSLVAQWMMTRKLLENWALWVALDVVYVAVFISRGLRLTAMLYLVFLVLAAFGHFEWKRSFQQRLPASS